MISLQATDLVGFAMNDLSLAPDRVAPGARPPQIIAFGGGGFSMERGNPLLDDYVLSLTGRLRPRVCFLPTASGDADHYVVRFYREFADRAQTSHLTLFRRERGRRDVREHLLAQDLIYVGGGSVVSLLGVWRAHGIDQVLREAWEAGVVLCGLSAGALCWFAQSLTAYYGRPEPIEALGFLPWSFTAHFDSEPARRDEYRRRLMLGMMRGFAADDGAALHFQGHDLLRAVSSRREARACSMRLAGGRVLQERLPVTFLGEQPCPPLEAPLMPARPAPAVAA
jgi:dipeptidase E